MSTKQVTVEFTCHGCGTSNSKTVSVEREDETNLMNLRRKRTVDIDCKVCGKINSVEVDE